MSLLQGFEAVSPAVTAGKSVLTVTDASLHFNKGTVLELGNPEYIKFYINAKAKQFAIQPCAGDDANAIAFCKPGSPRASVTLKTPVLLEAMKKYFQFEETPEDQIAFASMHGTSFLDDKAVVFDVNEATYGIMKKRGRKKAA